MIVGNIFMLWVGGSFIYYSITEGFGKGTAETVISIPVSILGAIIVWANLKAMLKE
jgi:membrane protein implicated in regulation of membrane protease activity